MINEYGKTKNGNWDLRTYHGKLMQRAQERGPRTTAQKIERLQQKRQRSIEVMEQATKNIVSITNKIDQLLKDNSW